MKKVTLLAVLLQLFTTTAFSQDQFYAICEDLSLYLIDPSSCSADLIGRANVQLTDIAIHPQTGVFYGITGDELYRIDPNNAQTTFLGKIETGLPFNIHFLNAATFDLAGTLYAADANSDSLFAIDVDAGTFTTLGSMNTRIGSGGDLTFYNRELYLAGQGLNLIQIDLDNLSQSRAIGRFNALSDVYGFSSMGCPAEVFAAVSNDLYQVNETNILNLEPVCLDIVPFTIYGTAAISENITESLTCFPTPPEIKLIMPNAFSPNGDGINDLFVPVEKEGVTIIRSVIYNRWGQEVYASDHGLVAWDGKNEKGEPVPAGSYFWRLEFIDGNREMGNQNGIINVLYE